jgi:hypothetical protein
MFAIRKTVCLLSGLLAAAMVFAADFTIYGRFRRALGNKQLLVCGPWRGQLFIQKKSICDQASIADF